MFRSRSALQELVRANPVSLGDARALAARVGLDEIVRYRIAWEPLIAGTSSSATIAVPPVRRTRAIRAPRFALASAALAAAAVAFAASPALGFLKQSVLPFFGLERAPASVQLDFSSLALGAPAGMDPRSISDQTRKVATASFAGSSHVLWVAPTALGGFCYEWTPSYGGCNADGTSKLDAIGEAVIPAGTPGQTLTSADSVGAIEQGHQLATVTPWLVGYVTGDDTQTLRVNFSDGSSADVQPTWVSTPISAGFYSYDVPQNEQTSSAHVVSVEAVTADGKTVTAVQKIATGG